MYIWNELSLPKGKRDGFDKMVGADTLATDAISSLFIPLEFWFCRNPGLALPLIALQYHEVKINIEFRPLADLVQGVVGTPLSLDASLWVDYIFLDTDERRRFAQLSHEYLIEQLQFTGEEAFSSTSVSQNAIIRPKLSFNHPVKELVWVVQRDAAVSTIATMDWFNYNDGSAAFNNPVVKAKLQLNGHDRFAERKGMYFSIVQPFQHHENVPYVGGKDRSINVYSFALKPEEHQPSGTLNMSRIDSAILQLEILANIGTGKVRIYAINYNVLRVMSGMGGLNANC